MSRLLKRLLLFCYSFFMLIGISSCGFMNTGDQGLMIDSITSVLQDDGSTLITINFTDEDEDPISFIIPAGTQGEQGETGATGVGIDHIDTVEDEENRILTITIYFTDETMEPEVITVPLGTTITGIETTVDLDGDTIVTIYLSDGTSSSFTVTNGTDAIGIQDITYETDDVGNTTITITMTDGTIKTIYIPYVSGKDGEAGVGIDYIDSTYDDDTCTITIYLTDGTSYDVDFPLPTVGATWYTGNGTPSSAAFPDAKSGDLYYDLTNNRIFYFTGTRWELLISLDTNDVECTITFDANGGVLDSNYSPIVTCQYGETLDISQIPTASKDGCTFEGWYTSAIGPNDPNSGHFTDLTPVVKDLTLWAYYVEIE